MRPLWILSPDRLFMRLLFLATSPIHMPTLRMLCSIFMRLPTLRRLLFWRSLIISGLL